MTARPDSAPQDLTITTTDGTTLAATLYGANASGPITVIASGAAIRRRYYAPFAQALAERGRPTLTFDYRGIGGSLPGPITQFKARMRDWGIRDIPAVIAWSRATYPNRPLHWVGHSYGGGFGLGLAWNNTEIARALTIATPHGYWGDMDKPERYRIGALVGLAMPILIAASQRLPGRIAGTGEDLPAGVAREWRRWIMARNSLFDVPDLPEVRHFKTMTAPMRFLRVADDPWASDIAVQRISAEFSNAPHHIVRVAPPRGEKIGHLGFFRPRFETSLWPTALDWLDQTQP